MARGEGPATGGAREARGAGWGAGVGEEEGLVAAAEAGVAEGAEAEGEAAVTAVTAGGWEEEAETGAVEIWAAGSVMVEVWGEEVVVGEVEMGEEAGEEVKVAAKGETEVGDGGRMLCTGRSQQMLRIDQVFAYSIHELNTKLPHQCNCHSSLVGMADLCTSYMTH